NCVAPSPSHWQLVVGAPSPSWDGGMDWDDVMSLMGSILMGPFLCLFGFLATVLLLGIRHLEVSGTYLKSFIHSSKVFLMPGSKTEWPASGMTLSSDSGQALLSSKALMTGQTISYLP